MGEAVPITLKDVFKEALKTKSGLIGFIMILSVAALALITPFIAPYDVVKQWSNPTFWIDNPRLAMPIWVDFFLGKKLPTTIIIEVEGKRLREYMTETKIPFSGRVMEYVRFSKTFTYEFDDVPSELRLDLWIKAKEPPLARIYITRPDGVVLRLYDDYLPVSNGLARLYLSHDKSVIDSVKEQVVSRFGQIIGKPVLEDLLFRHYARTPHGLRLVGVEKGEYTVTIELMAEGLRLEKVKLVVYGKVHGLFGTDALRRDIALGIFWGAPIDLAFGLVAAIIVTLIQAFLGAFGAWWGRIHDEIIQRLTDVFLIMPVLPILILISFLYKVRIWILLLVVIALSILGSVTKVSRTIALQVMSEQYIEAAISYGAGKLRILIRYIMPRILPYAFALITMSVPSYIFLEASLCILGLGDPELPTWGRILGDAWSSGAIFHGYWWWALTPAFFIAWTAIGFALLGYTLDKIVNPRLREY